MLILDTQLSYNDLKYLSKVNDETYNMNVCEYIERNESIVIFDSNIIEKQNNFIIVEGIHNFIDLILGFISDLPIKKIDILYKINEEYEFIKTIIPEIKNIDVISQLNPDGIFLINLNNPDTMKNIEKVTKRIYKFPKSISRYPFYTIVYKLFFDDNLTDVDISNNKVFDVGVFINEIESRRFIINHNMPVEL